jgi:multidrug resistance efflux pump
MSDTVTFVPPAVRPASAGQYIGARAFSGRNLKIGLALTLVGAGGYAVLAGQGYISSDNAVVTTYTVSLRTPISGYVSGLRVKVGDTVAAGTVLARINDPRVDDQRLIDLESLLARFGANRQAYMQEHAKLSSQLAALVERAAKRNLMQTAFLVLQADEAERQLRARNTEREYAFQDLGRKATLGQTGDAPTADVDKARSTAGQANHNFDAGTFRLAYLRLQAESARQGMLLESGSADLPYSSQRADEIGIRIAEIEREITFLTASLDETAKRLDAERRRVALLRGVDLIAPSAGMVWKLGASEGERLSVGDAAAELVDCTASFVIASIPQDRFPDVEIGANARIRLSGETVERVGHVTSLTGEATLANDRTLAAAPVGQPTAAATARIEIGPSGNAANDCLVGRTSRVLLPASPGSGLLARLARRVF